MKKLLCLVICSLVLFTGCGDNSYFQSTETTIDENETVEETTETENEEPTGTIFVQVAGAVIKPDVYELAANSRVYEAIEAAGGLLDTADDADINQAELLTDGQKIYIYTKAERELAQLQANESEAAGEDDGRVNINTASLEELKSLPGIGDSKANLIISYREANGAFSSIEDIKNVTGIGDGIFAQIEAYIKV